jgi:HAD superfamily hydrolase (TIGR01509 family)
VHRYQLLCGRIQAVLYDLDGTLADTEELLFEVWVEMLSTHGQAFTLEDYLGIIGTPEDEKVPELLARFGIAEDPKAFYARFTTRLKERMASDLKPMPGAEESLKKSAVTRAPIGLVTSATDWHATHALEALGFKKYFYPGGRVTADTPGLTARKPHPAPYLLAAKLLRARTAGCIVFEDSVHGATAARAAGMLVVGVPHRLTSREKLTEIAHHVIPEGKTIADFVFTDIPYLDALLPKSPR